MAGRNTQERQIRRLAGKAIGDFGLIDDGDRILVALSGGKDSWTLLHVLEQLRRRAPVSFSLIAVTVHPGFPGFSTEGIEQYCRERGFVHHVVPAAALDAKVDERVGELLKGGPEAQKRIKMLFATWADTEWEEYRSSLPRTLAEVRSGDEAKDGLAAFFEKRKPRWMVGA